MRVFCLLILLCIVLPAYTQKQDYIWHLGIDQGPQPNVQAMQVDFNKGVFHIDTMDFLIGFDNNNQAVCDYNGNLLFYTNGCAVVNRAHEVMPGGELINDSSFREITGWNDCRSGYPGHQNVLILDDPSNNGNYYVIHKTFIEHPQISGFPPELRMTYIDMSLDNGLGEVLYYDSIIVNQTPLSSYLNAIKHANKNDWWILQPAFDSEEIMTFRLDQNGIHRIEDQNGEQYFDRWYSSASGKARFSPDGTKYAYYNRWANLHLYDFDRNTGLLSNHQKIQIYDMPADSFDLQFASVEWSPNSRFAYLANRDSLHQIDTWEQNIETNGIALIDIYNGTLDPFPTNFFVMALAPDCKIYMCSTNGNNSYHVINEPDKLGSACDFVQNGIKLPRAAGSANLPLHPRWRVDEEEKCDPTITSIFGEWVYYRRDLKVYPNPAIEHITIEIPENIGETSLNIYNQKGKILYSQIINSGNSTLFNDINNFPSGIYNVELIPKINPERIFYWNQIVKIK